MVTVMVDEGAALRQKVKELEKQQISYSHQVDQISKQLEELQDELGRRKAQGRKTSDVHEQIGKLAQEKAELIAAERLLSQDLIIMREDLVEYDLAYGRQMHQELIQSQDALALELLKTMIAAGKLLAEYRGKEQEMMRLNSALRGKGTSRSSGYSRQININFQAFLAGFKEIRDSLGMTAIYNQDPGGQGRKLAQAFSDLVRE